MANLRARHWRHWYNDKQHRARRKHQLQVRPFCEEHLKRGELVAASIADHAEAHGGDITKFRTGKLRSLCPACHNRKWSDDKRGYSDAVSADGDPIDPRHPYHKDRS
jgi:5-methylcytosine-specific restriction protein A